MVGVNGKGSVAGEVKSLEFDKTGVVVVEVSLQKLLETLVKVPIKGSCAAVKSDSACVVGDWKGLLMNKC